MPLPKKKYGKMFEALGVNKKYILEITDKNRWVKSMNRLLKLRDEGTVAEVVSHLRKTRLPQLPDSVEHLEKQLGTFNQKSGEEMPRPLTELSKLHPVDYQEIISLTGYLEGHSPFETKHGVKGAEFENVLVVIGRGWNHYDFGKMLALAQKGTIPDTERDMFERNRNLFYVTCSRSKKRLALLFTQEISEDAMRTVETWFGAVNIHPVEF